MVRCPDKVEVTEVFLVGIPRGEFEGVGVLSEEDEMKPYVAYALSIAVIVISALLVIFLPVNDETKTMFSLPGIAGLFSILVQGWRDQISHERALELQKKQHDFDLAIASHMANVVFDKQVEFTEQYSSKLYTIVRELFQEGPSDKASIYERDLRDIRIRFSPWISKDLNEKLIPYEFALGKIGNLGILERATRKTVEHSDYVYQMFETFKEFIGLPEKEFPKESRDAANAVLEHLKDVLNIFDLEMLRRSAIRLAMSNPEANKK